MTALLLRDVSKTFGQTRAVEHVDLNVSPGEVLAIVGENGAGKSTLLNIMAKALAPDRGEVQIAGRVAYIRQELALCPHLSVAENVFMGREPSRLGFVDRPLMRARTRTLLSEFGRPEIDPATSVGELSPASRQVVEICRALASDATVILMDEPTSSLPRPDVDRLFAAIRTLCARGIAIVYVSHFLEEIREIASRTVVLRDGATVWSGDLSSISDAELISHMVGRPYDPAPAIDAPRSTSDIALVADSLPGASFTLKRGQILGIAGLVGSGRTELLRALFGLDSAQNGQLSVNGRTLQASDLSPARSIAEGLGYLSEDRNIEGLFPHLSVRENIAMTRLENRNVAQWIDRFKIRVADHDSVVTHLSGGNQQKALMARLLHQGASVLLLDEPTRGIDVGSKAQIYDHIRALSREGRAILMVSSYLPELFALCDSLAVMTHGRLSEVRPIEEWTPATVLQAAISSPVAA